MLELAFFFFVYAKTFVCVYVNMVSYIEIMLTLILRDNTLVLIGIMLTYMVFSKFVL